MVAQIFLYVKTFFEKSEDFFMQRTNTEIAESIRALAGARGVTLKQTLADCGINRNFIYDLEHGNSSPSVDKIARIAAYFGVSSAAATARTAQTARTASCMPFLRCTQSCPTKTAPRCAPTCGSCWRAGAEPPLLPCRRRRARSAGRRRARHAPACGGTAR